MRINVRTITPARLVLNFRPLSVRVYWLFGVLFMALGVGTAVLLARSVSLRCLKADGYCYFDETSVFGKESRLLLLADLRGATVETRVNGLLATMTLVAMLRQGEQEVPMVAADGATKDSLAAELNKFVADPSMERFAAEENTRVIGYAFGAGLVVAGLACLVAIERVRLVLDRKKGLLRLTRSRWLWARRAKVALNRVKRVETRALRVGAASSWWVIVVLDEKTEMPLTAAPLFTFQSAEQAQQILSRWLA